MELRRVIIGLFALAGLLGIAILVVGLVAFGDFIYSQVIYGVVGGMIAAFSLALIPRALTAPDNRRLGEVTVVHAWWIFSGGLGGLMIYLAPLFNNGHPAAAATLLAASLASIVIGVYLLAIARAKLGVSLAV